MHVHTLSHTIQIHIHIQKPIRKHYHIGGDNYIYTEHEIHSIHM